MHPCLQVMHVGRRQESREFPRFHCSFSAQAKVLFEIKRLSHILSCMDGADRKMFNLNLDAIVRPGRVYAPSSRTISIEIRVFVRLVQLNGNFPPVVQCCGYRSSCSLMQSPCSSCQRGNNLLLWVKSLLSPGSFQSLTPPPSNRAFMSAYETTKSQCRFNHVAHPVGKDGL